MINMSLGRAMKFAAMIVAGLSLAACANNPNAMNGANAGLAGNAAPGSAQDFVVNVGDRVLFCGPCLAFAVHLMLDCLVRGRGTLDCKDRPHREEVSMRSEPRPRLAHGTALAALWLLTACGQSNTYQPPPPPKVMVAKPVE